MLFKIMDFARTATFALLLLAGCSGGDAPAKKTKAEAETPAAAKAEPETEAAKIALKNAELPQDVAAFVARREGCDHFRGEEAYDEERGRFIRENLDKLCKGTDAELAALKGKYAKDAKVTEKLSGFEVTIE